MVSPFLERGPLDYRERDEWPMLVLAHRLCGN
jgi:hypothetical protein